MTIIVAALVAVPIAWNIYLVVRALKTGVYNSWSLTGPADRHSRPTIFWFGVAQRSLFSVALMVPVVAVALHLSGLTLIKVFGVYMVVHIITVVVATFSASRQRSNQPLERTGSAGRSAPDC